MKSLNIVLNQINNKKIVKNVTYFYLVALICLFIVFFHLLKNIKIFGVLVKNINIY